jgi:hypothetical protein
MQVSIPDFGTLNLPNNGQSIEEVRRSLVQLGYTQVANAQATQDAAGNITFTRATGGTKGGQR